jgi:hypothetical protein
LYPRREAKKRAAIEKSEAIRAAPEQIISTVLRSQRIIIKKRMTGANIMRVVPAIVIRVISDFILLLVTD